MATVLVFQNGPRATLPLVADLEAAGFQVLGVVDDCSKLVQGVVRHAPDLLVGEAALPGDALFTACRSVADTAPRPVIVFTTDADAERIARAVASGIQAYEVNGYGAARLRALVHLATARFAHEQALAAQLSDVTQRLEDRKMVERAKGILMSARQVSDDEAFQILRTASMHTNQRLGQVSQHIIHSAHFAESVNRAGQLRMLSQRLVKLHLLRGAGVLAGPSGQRLADSVARIDANLGLLGKGLSAASFGDLLAQVLATWKQLHAVLLSSPDQIGAADALAERLLQEAERLTASLQSAGSVAPLQVLNQAGRQRMLSQRFAKLVLMEVLGAGGADSEALTTAAQRDFEQGLAYLNSLPLSTPDIRQALEAAARDWQQMLAATPQAGRRPAGRDRQARLETIATASESLLDCFEQLSEKYEHSMQMLMG
jgi:AmiR/NasT family two-component response regulator